MMTRYEHASRTLGAGYLFGVPVNDFGLFASVLIGVAAGMAAFFAATFCGIIFILFWNAGGHHTGPAALDYAASYKWVGLPIGVAVMACALAYLGTLWIRRKTAR